MYEQIVKTNIVKYYSDFVDIISSRVLEFRHSITINSVAFGEGSERTKIRVQFTLELKHEARVAENEIEVSVFPITEGYIKLTRPRLVLRNNGTASVLLDGYTEINMSELIKIKHLIKTRNYGYI